jgi:hypothetical protein
VIAVVGLALYLGLRYWKKRMLEDI